MALELASRALGVKPTIDADGVGLAGKTIPSPSEKPSPSHFPAAPNDIPSYSLADLRACLDKGDKEYFRRQFAGKVVLVGSDVASADQILTSKRFADPPLAQDVERCASPAPASGPRRRSMSGVYLQAMAVDNLIRREVLREIEPWKILAISFAAAAMIGSFALAFGPLAASLGGAIVALIWIALAAYAFQHFLVLPLLEPIVSGAVAIGGAAATGLGVADREKRFLRRAFGLYLAPERHRSHDIVGRVADAGRRDARGHVVFLRRCRILDAFRSDEAGGDRFADERLFDCDERSDRRRRRICRQICRRRHRSDIWRAGSSADHAIQAVAAALDCQRRLDAFNREHAPPIQHRIGLNTGKALIGNIGSRRRFNYTAFGDSVNLASRLEQANTNFGTSILAAESVVAATGALLSGARSTRSASRAAPAPVTVFEPLCRRGDETQTQCEIVQAYEDGLRAWRAREFKEAEVAFARFPDDAPAASFRKRCLALVDGGPAGDWDHIFTLPSK